MRKSKLRLKLCGRITAIVILLSFLRFPVWAMPLETLEPNLIESEMKLYTDSEVDLLIDVISEAAYEAIEVAAAEAAKAAVLALLEREAAAYREASRQLADAQRWQLEADLRLQAIRETKKAGVKNAIIAGVTCLVGGFLVGVGGALIIGGR